MRGFLDQIYNQTSGQKEQLNEFSDAEITELARQSATRRADGNAGVRRRGGEVTSRAC